MRTLLLLLALQCCSTCVFGAEAVERVVFVGTFIKIDEVTCYDERRVKPGTKYEFGFALTGSDGQDVLVTCHKRQFELTFRVERVLEGKARPGDRVKFFAYESHRLPEIALQQRSLLSIDRSEGGRWELVDWNEAYATTEGRFAQCGCKIAMHRYDQADMDAGEACTPFDFKPIVRYSLVDLSNNRIASYQNDHAYEVNGDFAKCKRGVEVNRIVRAWAKRDEEDKE